MSDYPLSRFKAQTLASLALLISIMLMAVFAWQRDWHFLFYAILLILFCAVLIHLFSVVNKTNTQLAQFLINIKYDDYEAHYSASADEQDQKDLSKAFNLITDKFRTIRQQKEFQFQYMQAIVEHVDAGLISFNDRGETVLMNRGLQRLLNKSHFPSLNSIKRFNTELYESIQQISPGEQKLVKLVTGQQILQLSIRKTILAFTEDRMHLYAIQNIQTELENQELESWQKLIRILTHEILNSVTPVISLSEITKELINKGDLSDEQLKEDVKNSIEAIHRRSTGLLRFTETYRKMTRVPVPKFELIEPVSSLERVVLLFSDLLTKHEVEITRLYPNNLFKIWMDPDLMDQVFLNLIKNALEAQVNGRKPHLSLGVAKNSEGICEISISDNGQGISKEELNNIFIPFYTTKKEGSGIGLSICRQIVQLHKGSIHVFSTEGKGTSFVIRI